MKAKVKATTVNDNDGKNKQPPDGSVGGNAGSADKSSKGDGSGPSTSAAETGAKPEVVVTVDDLYGPGKRYPAPFDATRPPNMHIHERHMRKKMGLSFVYAVRFRMGPFGFAFDNKVRYKHRQYTLSMHPTNTSYQHTLPTQSTLSTRRNNTPYPGPIDTPYHHTLRSL